MKKARYTILVLLSSLLMMLTGCERRELLEDYPVSGIQVKLNWNGVTDKLPEGMKIIFYPKDDEGVKIESFLSAKGGEVVKVPPGRYAVIAYNYDTERVRVSGAESYETIEAIATPCGDNVPEAENMVWAPDMLYVVNIEEVKVENTEEVAVLEVKPKPVVEARSFSIKAEGLKNVVRIVGSVEGLAEHYLLNGAKKKCCGYPIYFELKKGDGVIEGTFTAFGIPDEITRVEAGQVVMKLKLIKVDQTLHGVEVDITEMVNTPLPPPEVGGEGSPGVTPPPVEIEMPPGKEIVVEDVKPIVPPGGGGGIGGDVGDWGEENNVELPVK